MASKTQTDDLSCERPATAMIAKPSVPSRSESSALLNGSVALLMLVMMIQSHDRELSTGKAELKVIGASHGYGFSTDPAKELLRLTHAGGMSGAVTAYTLSGDGKLAWRWMGHYAEGFQAIEIFEGYQVAHLYETELSHQEMLELLSIAVEHGLATTSTKDLVDQMGGKTYRRIDAGTSTLELRLNRYRKWGGPTGSIDTKVSISDPSGASTRFPLVLPLQGIVKLSEYMNRKLGML